MPAVEEPIESPVKPPNPLDPRISPDTHREERIPTPFRPRTIPKPTRYEPSKN